MWALTGSLADAGSWIEFLVQHEKKLLTRLLMSGIYYGLACIAFIFSFRTRYATKVLVRIQDVGFFSNYLAVIDVLARVGPGTTVVVDWTLTGGEVHFTYGTPGLNVWKAMFAETVIDGITVRGRAPTDKNSDFLLLPEIPTFFFRYHSYFTADMKAYWGGAHLDAVAARYSRFAGQIRIASEYVEEAVNGQAFGDFGKDVAALGVHKRADRAEAQTGASIALST